MTTVTFYDRNDIEDGLLQYAVIVSRYQEKWIYVRHKERTTWEVPRGKREQGEGILAIANRELFEETGASDYRLFPVSCYCVETEHGKSYGLLCYGEIKTLGSLPPSEIACIHLFDGEPKMLTYPLFQPPLFRRVRCWLQANVSVF